MLDLDDQDFALFWFQDEKYLIWYSGQTEKQLKLSSVKEVISGQVCKKCLRLFLVVPWLLGFKYLLYYNWDGNSSSQIGFQGQLQPEKECQSFSLICGERSLDLVILAVMVYVWEIIFFLVWIILFFANIIASLFL